MSVVTLVSLTALALVAFAFNSILCRLALSEPLLDAGSFTILRLSSGALALLALVRLASPPASQEPKAGTLVQGRPERGSWSAAFALFAYAAPFSYAYLDLDAGIGALVLFGCVQVTMIGYDFVSGRRPRAAEWIGLALALSGLLLLALPGASAPPLAALGLMAVSGIMWGTYSISGRTASRPLLSTRGNFARSLVFLPLVGLVAALWVKPHMSWLGALYAFLSGAVTSGLGYALWYAALPHLSSTRSALVQLLVPILAAFGGVLLLYETVSLRLVASSCLILGGVALSLLRGKLVPNAR